jgi:hypothetical protein
MTTTATGGASDLFSTSPLDRLGFGVGGYSGGGEPLALSPWPPLPLIVLHDRAHQPSNGLGVPDPDASQGTNGRPIGGEINPTVHGTVLRNRS